MLVSCQHKREGRCTVAETYGGGEIRPTDLYCEYCMKESDPQSINCVTLNLAVQARRKANRSYDDVLDLSKEFCKPKAILGREEMRGGPGTELKKLIPKFMEHKGCGCNDYARKLDQYGVEGCRKRFDEIVKHLVEKAKLIPVAGSLTPMTALVAKKWVRTAIERAEQNERRP